MKDKRNGIVLVFEQKGTLTLFRRLEKKCLFSVTMKGNKTLCISVPSEILPSASIFLS